MKRNFYSIFALCTALILSGINAHCQTISTIAGGGIGDNQAANLSILLQPTGLAVDSAGNLYISDRDHNRIRKVSTSGTITTVAGNGLVGFTGDGIAATSSRLNKPTALAIDRLGNLYISDNGNHRVRKVNPAGIISTVAGDGVPGFLGDGAAATAAEFNNISGLAVDSLLQIYIADQNNHRVRKVNTFSQVSTIAGNGSPYFSGDGGQATSAGVSAVSVALDGLGNIYVGDANYYIRKITQFGVISSIAGNGSPGFSGDNANAVGSGIDYAYGLCYNKGYLYVADYNNSVIRQIDLIGGIISNITTIAGVGVTPGYAGDGGLANATSARLSNPTAVVVDTTGNIFIADQTNMVIRKVNTSNILSTYAGAFPVCCNGDPALVGGLITPKGVTADIFGNVFVADAGNHVIRRIDHSSTQFSTIAGTGRPAFTLDGGPADTTSLNTPTDVITDPFGNLYIADQGNQRIREVTIDGNINTIAGSGTLGFAGDGGAAIAANLNNPTGVALDNNGNLYIADRDNHVIRMVDASGNITTVAGTSVPGYNGDGIAATAAQLQYPTKVIADLVGNIYIADMGNHRIREVTADGMIHTIAGNGIQGFSGDKGPAITARLDSPMSVGLDPFGNIYVSDYGNHRVRIIIDTIIYEMAGNGIAGFSGDGGPAVLAQLDHPAGIFADANQNLYIADQDNARIRFTTKFVNAVPQVMSNAANIRLYPNPNEGTFTVQGSVLADNNKAEMSVLNAIGQLVYANNIATANDGAFTHTISMGDKFANGIYFLRIKTNSESKTVRFTLEK